MSIRSWQQRIADELYDLAANVLSGHISDEDELQIEITERILVHHVDDFVVDGIEDEDEIEIEREEDARWNDGEWEDSEERDDEDRDDEDRDDDDEEY